jgi:hypothetical protein
MRDTIDMAREAGLLTWLKPPEDVIERFKAFEALVRADEREACATVCDDLYRVWTLTDEDDIDPPDALDCKRAIRARGNT